MLDQIMADVEKAAVAVKEKFPEMSEREAWERGLELSSLVQRKKADELSQKKFIRDSRRYKVWYVSQIVPWIGFAITGAMLLWEKLQ